MHGSPAPSAPGKFTIRSTGVQVLPLSKLRRIAMSMLLGRSPGRSTRASHAAMSVPLVVTMSEGMRYVS